MNYAKLLQQAQQAISSLSSGEEFELKDLFDKATWNSMSEDQQREFGRIFADEVRQGRINGVEYVKTRSDHHNVYRKL